MKKLIVAILGGSVAGSLLAAPAVTDGSVKLHQDGTRKVVVEYEITGEPAIVTAAFSENGTVINEVFTADVWGDINKKVDVGTHTFCLDPSKFAPDREVAAANLNVKLSAWATNCPPDYLVADLCFTNVVKYYANTNSFPGGFGSDRYKTTELVMRRIPAANIEWRMGNPSWVNTSRGGGLASNPNHYVTISDDYYMAVYELTVAQTAYVTAGGATSKMPQSGSYNSARGTDFTWPTDGHKVAPSSILGKIRGLTGLEFDLPTEAQWEYACRAGNQWIMNFEWKGGAIPANGKFQGDSWNVGGNSDPYAWFERNSGNVAHETGLLLPNTWGLYDMHGNMIEWCLDWLETLTTDSQTDPKGPTTGTARVQRGGYFNDSCTPGLNGSRMSDAPTSSGSRYGFRLVCPIGE